ncbi:MAG: acetate/propionate family kinase [Candidatus Hodarchaeales archaeon]
MIVLTINCGSSSLKYSLYEIESESLISKGLVERIGQKEASIRHWTKKTNVNKNIRCPDHSTAIKLVIELLLKSNDKVIASTDEIKAVGHRVVHGGEDFLNSIIIDSKVLEAIDRLSSLAPLHNPHNLSGILAAKKILPNIPHIAVFDTAFHQTLPDYAYRYAIPNIWYTKEKIRKYGFHGTSHYYVSQKAINLLKKKGIEGKRIITIHLGNGASITAIKDGKSIDTSMGLTPLEGLVMGTRSGDIDPGAVLALANKMSVKEVDRLLNKQSGYLGLTGLTNDMRDIEQNYIRGDEKAILAVKMAAYRVKKYIGAYFAILGGLDAIVFTAGIGENSHLFRFEILKELKCLGIEIDENTNKLACGGLKTEEISSNTSKVKVFVIPTNEELVIVQEVAQVLKKQK